MAKVDIFAQRSVNQNIEAAFDFVRQNRLTWFRGSLLYLLPYSVLISLLWLPSEEVHSFDSNIDRIAHAIATDDFALQLLPGFFLAALFSMSRLRRYLDHPLDGLSWRQLASLARPVFFRTFFVMILILAVEFAAIVVPSPSGLLLQVVVVPLCFLLPSYVLVGNDFTTAVPLSLKYGFRKWFQLLIVLVFMMFIAVMMCFAFQVPCELFHLLTEFFSKLSQSLSQLYASVMCCVDLCLIFYALFAGASFVVIAISMLYGSAEEDNGEMELEEDIDNFENL